MSFYILAENKGMPALEAIRRSKEMMDGHKMDYFVLELSFLGWSFLCAITLGIASIWVIPYITATTTNFYNAIKFEKFPITAAVAEPNVYPELSIFEKRDIEIAQTADDKTEQDGE